MTELMLLVWAVFCVGCVLYGVTRYIRVLGRIRRGEVAPPSAADRASRVDRMNRANRMNEANQAAANRIRNM